MSTTNCISPCTISKHSANDLIANDNSKVVVPNTTTNMKIDIEILTKKIGNLENALALCQNREDSTEVIKLASDTIIRDLLS